MIKVTVCGSFNRFMDHVREGVAELHDLGCEVLSPHGARPVSEEGGFIFLASDVSRCVREVEDKHLAAINDSDFVWLVCPTGYVGMSGCLEIGFAVAGGIPIYALIEPKDIASRWYVEVVPSLKHAVELAEGARDRKANASRLAGASPIAVDG